jgi:hypothetical protein
MPAPGFDAVDVKRVNDGGGELGERHAGFGAGGGLAAAGRGNDCAERIGGDRQAMARVAREIGCELGGFQRSGQGNGRSKEITAMKECGHKSSVQGRNMQ